MHDNVNHFGENKTIERIKSKYYWKRIDKDEVDYIKTCETCQQNKHSRTRPREEAITPDTPDNPNDKIALDIIGPFPIQPFNPRSTNQYLLLIPLDNQKAETIIDKLIHHYIYIFSSARQTCLNRSGTKFRM